VHIPRFGQRFGVFHGDVEFQIILIEAVKTLDHVQLIAVGVADAVEPAYYSGLQHRRSIESRSAMQVSGHQAWVVTFLMTYPDAASEGLAWTSEAGAVVVVDRGAGRAPAVFYTSVPDDLGTSDVAALVSSLRLDR